MKIPTFFRFLNRKIEKYDKLATNPFTSPQPVTIIWVEEEENIASSSVRRPNFSEGDK